MKYKNKDRSIFRLYKELKENQDKCKFAFIFKDYK